MNKLKNCQKDKLKITKSGQKNKMTNLWKDKLKIKTEIGPFVDSKGPLLSTNWNIPSLIESE